MCECENGRRLLSGPNDPTAADARLLALLSLFTDVVSVEDWIGADLEVPAQISAEDLQTILQVAHAVRAGKAKFVVASWSNRGARWSRSSRDRSSPAKTLWWTLARPEPAVAAR